MSTPQFIAIDGDGDPNTSTNYAQAVEALYVVAYTLKFASKRAADKDFVVAPLEGLWWSDKPDAFTARAKDIWSWNMLISQPPWITADLIDEAKHTALAKKQLHTSYLSDPRRADPTKLKTVLRQPVEPAEQ